MEVIEAEIPPELKEDSAWIVWRWEERNGKWTKPPYQVNGSKAKSVDPATWTDFQSALNFI